MEHKTRRHQFKAQMVLFINKRISTQYFNKLIKLYVTSNIQPILNKNTTKKIEKDMNLIFHAQKLLEYAYRKLNLNEATTEEKNNQPNIDKPN